MTRGHLEYFSEDPESFRDQIHLLPLDALLPLAARLQTIVSMVTEELERQWATVDNEPMD